MTYRRSPWERLRAARDAGVRFVREHVAADGAVADPEQGFHFYRVPWALALGGETEAAVRVCAWVRSNMLTADGALEGPFRVYDDAYAYRDSALVIGAHLVLQYDLSEGLMPRLLSAQDPVSGAFANDRPPSDEMDIPYTCGPGFACLATGRIDAARRVAGHLRRIYEAQTELPDRFFYTWSRERQAPVTEFPEQRRFWYVVDRRGTHSQRWSIGGIAAGFLCRLYLAEPRPEYLELARAYQDFSMGTTDAQFGYVNVCKSSWGSSLLYQLTDELRYRAWSERMAEWYLERQLPDGRWQPDAPTTAEADVEITAEFVMHVDTILTALAA
jgi:hypothetical protein